MRQLATILFFLTLMAGGARAEGPAELPPSDFTGPQYIDSQGCVYTRSAQGWSPRLTAEGAPVCGFPPSRSAWSRSDDAEAPHGLDSVSRNLTVTVLSAEGALPRQPGQDRLPEKAAPDPVASRDTKLGAEIARQMALRPVVRAATRAAPEPGGRLCDLLGLQAIGGAEAGADPTGGYCGGTVGKALAMKQAAVAEPAALMAAKRAAAPGATSGASKLPERQSGATRAAAEGSTAGNATAKTAGQAKATTGAGIPPKARYILIGRFELTEAADAVAAIAGMGYPVVRERVVGVDGKRFVMAGPFATRERLISALDRLRRAGYAAAHPR